MPRSGTWATVRYAVKMHKLVRIIYPDGAGEMRYWVLDVP